MLAGLVSKKARLMICDYLARNGGEHLGIIANGIRDKRWYVVRNTVMILGRIGGEPVIEYLTATAGHADQRVREETFKALESMQSDRSIDLLARFLRDNDPELRRRSLTALGRIGGRVAFEAVQDIIRSSSFGEFTIDEQEQYLIIYSHLGGAEVTDYLNSLISSFSLLPSAERTRQKLAALKALAYNTSDEAERVILAHTRSRRQWLREAATAAMEHRRKLIYGGGESGDTHGD
jgi:HEAT repeat protein